MAGHKQLNCNKKHRHQNREKNCFRETHKSAIFQYKIESRSFFNVSLVLSRAEREEAINLRFHVNWQKKARFLSYARTLSLDNCARLAHWLWLKDAFCALRLGMPWHPDPQAAAQLWEREKRPVALPLNNIFAAEINHLGAKWSPSPAQVAQSKCRNSAALRAGQWEDAQMKCNTKLNCFLHQRKLPTRYSQRLHLKLFKDMSLLKTWEMQISDKYLTGCQTIKEIRSTFVSNCLSFSINTKFS